MSIHSIVRLRKPTQSCHWIPIDFSAHPLTWQRAHCLFYYNKENPAMCERGEHVIDWLYHRAIIFTWYTLVDAPALNHQHATPFSLSLSSSSNIPHAVRSHLYWGVTFCGVSFHSSFTPGVTFHMSTQFPTLASKWCFKRILMSQWLCGWENIPLEYETQS